jgi:hypothetical protein
MDHRIRQQDATARTLLVVKETERTSLTTFQHDEEKFQLNLIKL